MRACRQENGFGRIKIVNAGPGVTATQRQSVLLLFRGSQTFRRRVPGAGFGLSIAKLLVEAQGGRIDFHRFSERARPPSPVLNRFAPGRVRAA